MHRKCLLAALLTLALASLSSCALLPEEETLRTAPVIRSYQPPVYKLAQVERGDLVEVTKITCRYVPVQTERLSFALGGEYVDKLFVQVGDTVEAGQLVAQLQLGNLEERIADAQNSIAGLEIQMEYLEQQHALDARRQEITGAKLSAQERLAAEEKLREGFAQEMKKLQDDLHLQTMKLENLQRELADRQVRAPFAGTITSVSRLKEGDVSEFGTGIMTLVDSTMSLFRAETKHWQLFQPGDEYDIIVKNVPYPAVVADEESLGLEPQNRQEGKNAYVYFVLKETAFELKDGAAGSVEMVLSEHHDVLHLPREAISEAEEQAIVYYLREDGMKAWRAVETGVTIDGRTEILSGLSEGDSVITR